MLNFEWDPQSSYKALLWLIIIAVFCSDGTHAPARPRYENDGTPAGRHLRGSSPRIPDDGTRGHAEIPRYVGLKRGECQILRIVTHFKTKEMVKYLSLNIFKFYLG